MSHTQTISQVTQSLVEPRHLLAKAHSAMKWNFFETALHLSNSYLLFNSNHLEAQLIRAYCFLHTGEHEKAGDLFSNLLFKNPNSVSCMIAMSDYYLSGLDYDLAEGLLFQSLEMAADAYTKSDIIVHLSELYLLKGEQELALRTVKEVLDMLPFESASHFQEALVLIKMGRFSEAKKSLDITIQLNKEHAEAYRERARCWMMLNKVEYGLQDIKKAQSFELERFKILEALA